MSKAIHFGAGKIGRGFIGSVLNEAGYEVTFADVNQEIIDLINKEKGYAVHITGQNVYTKEIVGVSAVNISRTLSREWDTTLSESLDQTCISHTP